MAVVEIESLAKSYRVYHKAEGLTASLAGLFHRRYRDVRAVRGINLAVEAGEFVAFLGPNGAGKTTTLKLLSGVINPTSGTARVLGYVPWRRENAYRRRFALVMGQKNQLWWDLPAAESFRLHQQIYRIDRDQYERTRDELTSLLSVRHLLSQPVRELSLGERMKMELIAALLHSPDVLFLDEPTIGLDVVVKHRIRELIGELSREDGVTVFLTSHDAGDVEKVCRRAIVIDHGRLVLDLPVKKLKYDYLNRKLVSVRFFEPQSLPAFPGVTAIKQTGIAASLSVDTRVQPIGAVISALTGGGNVADITVSDPPMEDIIADIFASRNEAGS